MQGPVKGIYASIQAWLMFLAFLFVTLFSIVVVALESYNLAHNHPTISQLIIILIIFD